MADSMCGPSNAGKSLLNHATQDRSLHQDRIVQAPQAGPSGSFRNVNPAQANGSEMAFDNFQHQQGVPMGQFDMSQHNMLPGPALAPVIQHHAPQHQAAHHAAIRLDSPATGGMGHSWVNQFAGLQVGNALATPPASPSMGLASVAAPAMTGMGMGMGHFASAPFGFTSQFAPSPFAQAQMPFAAPATAQTEAPAAIEAHVETAEVRDAFEDLFGQYDAEAQAEKQATQEAYEADFEQEQANWMAEHGPQVQPPSTEEMAEIEEQMELNAAKQDTDHELARAAGDILQAVSLNSSEKFKHSNFLELMRRIATHEVVINNDNFVDIKSGDVVNTNELMPEMVPEDDVAGFTAANA
ncbi:putative PEX20 peroxisomal biogenesis factor 20 [Podospora australis]|uniref:PEX20 peroxisomal biogenesis factor 20 n=1 Tax=Podospora australis TaxID=1536484 RepID=A0AAN6WZG5_9PEZI|nr:putative PEX20 peroxisomal biogenesis factor 20 [Podospora australis]